MKLEEMQRIVDQARSTIQPESFWVWVDQLLQVARSAKALTGPSGAGHMREFDEWRQARTRDLQEAIYALEEA